MKCCKYHPIAAATYACGHCSVELCDQCADEGKYGSDVLCFICEKELESLGSVNQAEPFWHRFDKGFRYPLNTQSIILIISLALLTSVAGYLPFSVIIYLSLTGALFKYSFSCLQETANGLMIAPDITAAYGDGLGLLWRLLIIVVVIFGFIMTAYSFFGSAMAVLIGGLLVAALPATLIIFAMSDSILEAVNPLKQMKLITSIGLPYGLLLAIIMIMSASVGVISGVIGNDFSFLSTILQSVVSNYYTIVLFHTMGYMLFQYQGELGYTAREDYGERKTLRSDTARLLTRIKINVKEGNYSQALKLFHQGVQQHQNDDSLNSEFFKFLVASKNNQQIDKFAPIYLNYLEKNQQSYKLMMSFKQLLKVYNNYLPDTPELRFSMAKVCEENGDPELTVKLLKGLHKDFPDYSQLIPAYELVANAFDLIPDKSKQAKKCRSFIKHLEENSTASNAEKTALADEKANSKKISLIQQQSGPQLTLAPVEFEQDSQIEDNDQEGSIWKP